MMACIAPRGMAVKRHMKFYLELKPLKIFTSKKSYFFIDKI
jgi:hypothetical protein